VAAGDMHTMIAGSSSSNCPFLHKHTRRKYWTAKWDLETYFFITSFHTSVVSFLLIFPFVISWFRLYVSFLPSFLPSLATLYQVQKLRRLWTLNQEAKVWYFKKLFCLSSWMVRENKKLF